ncbi:MAG: hypothetical protein WCG20_03725 [bacterium]
MELAGAAPQPAPQPEHARKKIIIPEIATLIQQITQLSLKINAIYKKIISAKLLAVPDHVVLRKPIMKGTKKFLAREERRYATGTRELVNKKERLLTLLDELSRY